MSIQNKLNSLISEVKDRKEENKIIQTEIDELESSDDDGFNDDDGSHKSLNLDKKDSDDDFDYQRHSRGKDDQNYDTTISPENLLMNSERIFGKLIQDKLNEILEEKIKILKKENIDSKVHDKEDIGKPYVNAVQIKKVNPEVKKKKKRKKENDKVVDTQPPYYIQTFRISKNTKFDQL